VREHAIRLSETWLKAGKSTPDVLAEPLLRLRDDPNLRVRYQLAFSLGEWNDARAAEALAKLALKDTDSAPFQTAVLSSAPRHIGPMLTAVLAQSDTDPAAATTLENLLGLATALGNDVAISDALARLAQSNGGAAAAWQFAAFASFLEALERRDLTLEEFGKREGQTTAQMEKLFAQARSVAAATGAPEADRLAAIRLLARRADQKDADLQQLAALLHPQNPVALQQAALTRLGQEKGEAIGVILLDGWPNYGPALRNDTVTLLLTRKDWARRFLREMEQGRISPANLSAAQRQKLLKYSDESIREQAAKVLSATRVDRQALLKDYAEVANLKSDPGKGAMLFRQNCATCHRLRGEGNDVGPELGAVANKPLEALLVAILDPNQAVEWRYTSYTALTRNDREVSGLIVAETPTSITLRAPGGMEETILRRDLKNLKHSDVSLMPEGFEAILKPQDMADLLGFIAGL
jgi:putative heme-binding domain-containing protein